MNLDVLIDEARVALHARIDERHAILRDRAAVERVATDVWLRQRHAFHGRSTGQLRRFARERAGLA